MKAVWIYEQAPRTRIIYHQAMSRDAIMVELLEIEGMLQDDRPRNGTKLPRRFTGSTINRAIPFPSFCTDGRDPATTRLFA
jgi:hypothetical protein